MHPWIEAIYQLNRTGEAYVIVTILNTQGSTPRDRGTKMVVARNTSFGTIGGGNLEFQAISLAHKMLQKAQEQQHWETFPLGPSLGQCCGGSVTLFFECFPGHDFQIMLFGAGHVGTALVDIFKQLPCRLHWIDSRENQHTGTSSLPEHVTVVISDAPEEEVAAMPAGGYYIIATHNHQMDLSVLKTVLKRRDARYVGMIGSATKWKRFISRLRHMGYDETFYRHVRCPIGLPDVGGKHPMEVAISVAAEVLAVRHSTSDINRTESHGSSPTIKDKKSWTGPVHLNAPHKLSHVSS